MFRKFTDGDDDDDDDDHHDNGDCDNVPCGMSDSQIILIAVEKLDLCM